MLKNKYKMMNEDLPVALFLRSLRLTKNHIQDEK